MAYHSTSKPRDKDTRTMMRGKELAQASLRQQLVLSNPGRPDFKVVVAIETDSDEFYAGLMAFLCLCKEVAKTDFIDAVEHPDRIGEVPTALDHTVYSANHEFEEIIVRIRTDHPGLAAMIAAEMRPLISVYLYPNNKAELLRVMPTRALRALFEMA